MIMTASISGPWHHQFKSEQYQLTIRVENDGEIRHHNFFSPYREVLEEMQLRINEAQIRRVC